MKASKKGKPEKLVTVKDQGAEAPVNGHEEIKIYIFNESESEPEPGGIWSFLETMFCLSNILRLLPSVIIGAILLYLLVKAMIGYDN